MAVTRKVLLHFILLAAWPLAHAQGMSSDRIVEQLDRSDGCVTLDSTQVIVCKFDYAAKEGTVEAVTIRPAAGGPHPGIMMIPGFEGTAKRMIPLGVRLAARGFAAMAVTHPGFGRSSGVKLDYVGPGTINALLTGYRKFEQLAYVDPGNMGLYGYSRGAMAVSLLMVQIDGVKAAVLGAGIYDFQKLWNDAPMRGMRENMRTETGGMGERAIRERSSILQMAKLNAPVMILHGDADKNVPISQAYALRDELTRLNKPFELVLFPGRDHRLTVDEIFPKVIAFFARAMPGKESGHQR